jgi:putative transposase
MSRKPRIDFPGALYHVIARGNQKQDIFSNESDYETYLGYLSEYKTRFQFHLYAYALMKNHVHLLMEVGTTPLSRVMQSLQFRYSRHFNWKYKKVGHLFQGRYKAIICDKDSYLLELIRYIHLNPVRSELAKDPAQYPWTSHSIYLGKDSNGLVEEDFILSQFGKDGWHTIKNYEDFVLDGLNQGHREEFYEVRDQRILGRDEFVERIGSNKRERPALYDIPKEDIAEAIGRELGISHELMYSLTRDRQGALGRSFAAYLGRKLCGYSIVDMARHFERDPVVISQQVEKAERLMLEDGKLAKRIDRVEKELIRGRKKKYFVTNAWHQR